MQSHSNRSKANSGQARLCGALVRVKYMNQCMDPRQHGELQQRGRQTELERGPGEKCTFVLSSRADWWQSNEALCTTWHREDR